MQKITLGSFFFGSFCFVCIASCCGFGWAAGNFVFDLMLKFLGV